MLTTAQIEMLIGEIRTIEAEKTPFESQRFTVIREVLSDGPLPGSVISQLVQRDKSTLSRTLRQMMDEGIIKREYKGSTRTQKLVGYVYELTA